MNKLVQKNTESGHYCLHGAFGHNVKQCSNSKNKNSKTIFSFAFWLWNKYFCVAINCSIHHVCVFKNARTWVVEGAGPKAMKAKSPHHGAISPLQQLYSHSVLSCNQYPANYVNINNLALIAYVVYSCLNYLFHFQSYFIGQKRDFHSPGILECHKLKIKIHLCLLPPFL